MVYSYTKRRSSVPDIIGKRSVMMVNRSTAITAPSSALLTPSDAGGDVCRRQELWLTGGNAERYSHSNRMSAGVLHN